MYNHHPVYSIAGIIPHGEITPTESAEQQWHSAAASSL